MLSAPEIYTMKVIVRLGLMLALILLGVSTAGAQPARAPVQRQSGVAPIKGQSGVALVSSPEITVSVEVFPVLELPVAIRNSVLVKTKGGYLLRCSLSNSSEFRQLGLRYSLAVLDSSDSGTRHVVSRSEGFSLAAFQTDDVTFAAPLRLKLKGDERLVLMLQQSISTDYVWDILNPKESLTAYLTGDFSITPQVLRVRNQVDTRPELREMY
jgi:hypothetical protein